MLHLLQQGAKRSHVPLLLQVVLWRLYQGNLIGFVIMRGRNGLSSRDNLVHIVELILE